VSITAELASVGCFSFYASRDSLRELKGNREVCATTVAITRNLLLAEPAPIDRISAAIRKIQAYGAELARTA
jgi:hypothetical protein